MASSRKQSNEPGGADTGLSFKDRRKVGLASIAEPFCGFCYIQTIFQKFGSRFDLEL